MEGKEMLHSSKDIGPHAYPPQRKKQRSVLTEFDRERHCEWGKTEDSIVAETEVVVECMCSSKEVTASV
jgi:hypothetical protein